MSTAAERAAEVIRTLDQRMWDTHGEAAAAVDIIDALMADPDLLVDLAIEAGGLERSDDYTPCCGDSEFGPFHADGCDQQPRAHYRRASRPTGEDRP